MAKLNQILATERHIKTTAENEFTRIFHDIQKTDLLIGQARTYRPKDEGGEKHPDETKRVQLRAEDALARVKENLTKLLDATGAKDTTNCHARADVKVAGTVLLKDVPATHLLWLDKRLTDLLTLARKLPILDASESWHRDEAQGLWSTKPVESVKTKKITRPMVLVQATKEHPAQVKEVSEDVVAGYWSTTKYSGALPRDRVETLISRIEEVQQAVRYARQEANSVPVVELKSSPILDYIFA